MLLGAIFIALGYLISVVVRDRGTAAGIAVSVWLVFVVLYDMALLGALVADEGQMITTELFGALMLFNPTDLYRMFNLSGSGAVATMSGMAGLAAQAGFGSTVLLSAMAAWIAVPLAIAGALFARREL
jgi:Cu-processing system permease protein